MSTPRIAVLLCGLAISTTAHAAGAERTFVSASGSDRDRCSITSPCRTLAAALARTVPGGEIVVLDSGGYGQVTISQSVTIISPPGVFAGITVPDASTAVSEDALSGVTIAPGTYNVKLSGLTISGVSGSALGIWAKNSGQLTVESCVISGPYQGVYVEPASGQLQTSIKDTLVRDTNVGMYWTTATGSSVTGIVDHVRIDRAGNGIYVRGNATLEVHDSVIDQTGRLGAGLSVGAGPSQSAVMSVTNSIVSNGAGEGVVAEDSGGSVKLYITGSTVVSNASVGILSVGSGASNSSTEVVASRNNVLRNLQGLVGGFNSMFESLGDNVVRDNGTDIVGTITTSSGGYH